MMYENQTKSTAPHAATQHAPSQHAPSQHAPSQHAPRATSDTDPKFARESFTMRRMQPWQIAALAIAAAVVVALVVFYM